MSAQFLHNAKAQVIEDFKNEPSKWWVAEQTQYLKESELTLVNKLRLVTNP